MKREDVFKIRDLLHPYVDCLSESTITAYGTGEHSDLELTVNVRISDYSLHQRVKTKDGAIYSLKVDEKLLYMFNIDWTIPNICELLDQFAQSIIKRKKAIAQADADYHKIQCVISDDKF